MLRRDFTKSNKEYLKKNKIVLISVAVFLLIGLIIGAIFGLNGNFEVKGYNEFSVTIKESQRKNFNEYTKEIADVINSYDAKFDTVSLYGEGDNTKLVVRYLKDVNGADEIEINKLVSKKLDVEVEDVTEHVFVKPVMQNKDIVYTIAAILIIVLIATIFAYVRYNGASAMSIIIACLLGTFGYLSLSAILRLTIGMSYFAMLVILNMLIIYTAINIFENMHKSSWLMSEDYSTAMNTALKTTKFRMAILTIGIMLIGVLFAMIAPAAIKYVSLNIMYLSVVVLAVTWYVVPFVWSIFITRCRKRAYKVKATEIEDKKDKTN